MRSQDSGHLMEFCWTTQLGSCRYEMRAYLPLPAIWPLCCLIALSICHLCWPHRCHPCYRKVTFRLIPPSSQPCPATLLHSFPLDFEKGQTKRCLYGGREATFPVPSCSLDFTACDPVSTVSDGPIAHGSSHSNVSSFI